MGDDVVHLPGDPGPFLDGGDDCLLVAFAFELLRPVRKDAEGVVLLANVHTQHEAGHDQT